MVILPFWLRSKIPFHPETNPLSKQPPSSIPRFWGHVRWWFCSVRKFAACYLYFVILLAVLFRLFAVLIKFSSTMKGNDVRNRNHLKLSKVLFCLSVVRLPSLHAWPRCKIPNLHTVEPNKQTKHNQSFEMFLAQESWGCFAPKFNNQSNNCKWMFPASIANLSKLVVILRWQQMKPNVQVKCHRSC